MGERGKCHDMIRIFKDFISSFPAASNMIIRATGWSICQVYKHLKKKKRRKNVNGIPLAMTNAKCAKRFEKSCYLCVFVTVPRFRQSRTGTTSTKSSRLANWLGSEYSSSYVEVTDRHSSCLRHGIRAFPTCCAHAAMSPKSLIFRRNFPPHS